jgi:hypothetical protein
MSLQLLNPNEIISLEQLVNLYNELRESHSNIWNELIKLKYNSENGMVDQSSNEKNISLQYDRERALSLNRLQTTCQLSLALFNLQKENEKLVKDKQQFEKQISQLKQELEQKNTLNTLLLKTQIDLENAENLLKISECKHSDTLKELNNLKTTKAVPAQPTKRNHNRIELMNLEESYLQEQRELELATIRKNLSLVSFTEFETQQKLESVLSGNNILRVFYSGQKFKDCKNFLKQKITSGGKSNNESCFLNEYLMLIQQNAKILIDCLVMYKLEFSTLSISGTQYVYIDYYSSQNYEQDLQNCCNRFLEFLNRTLKTEPSPEFTKIVHKAIRKAGQFDDIQPKPKSLEKHVTWSVTLEPTKDTQPSDLPKTHPFVYRLLFLNSDHLVLSQNIQNFYKS